MRLKLGLIFFCALIPLCASAQELQFGLGPQAGVLSYNQDQISSTKLAWGGHARLRAFKYFAAEFSAQRREDNFNFRNGNIDLETIPLQLSGIVYPLGMFPVSPYFLAGTGWYFFNVTIRGNLGLPFVTGEGTISVTETAPHIGVGVEAFVGKHWSVGADARKVFLTFNSDIIRNIKFDAYFVNVGATFYF